MKKIFSILVLTAMSMSLQAQDKVEASVSADVVSEYMWRGMYQSEGSFQPNLSLDYKGFNFNVWGSTEFVGSGGFKEIELTLTYNIGNFSIGVQDDWDNSVQPKYFLYPSHKTGHMYEASLAYDFGPLSLSWYTMFAGKDGVNKNGDRAYSSYLELKAPFTLGGCEWVATLGAVPYATTFYDVDGFAINNVVLRATKNLQVTEKFTLPVFAEMVCNPAAQTTNFVLGLTLRP